jgi:hypothetical protein
MQPAARRSACLAALVLAALVALGGVNRSRNDWVARCEAEGASRAELESAEAERDRVHAEETDAMNRRIALLESDLARERELRSGAEARAVAAGKPVADEEALRGELARAYGRIQELERGDVAQELLELKDVQEKLAGQSERRRDLAVRLVESDCEGKEKTGCKLEEAPEDGNGSETKGVTASLGEVKIRVSKVIEVIRKIDDGRQTFDGGMNQGVDYVPQDGGNPDRVNPDELNMGVGYIEPPAAPGPEPETVLAQTHLQEDVLIKRLER